VDDEQHAGIAEQLRRVTALQDIEAYRCDQQALDAADRLLDLVEAGALLARGRTMHARLVRGEETDARELSLFERAAELYRGAGDARGEAEALFWLATCHQTVRRDDDAALPHFLRSRELAELAGDKLTLSCIVRHLGFLDVNAGRLPEARKHLEASVRLRREIGFDAGAAAGMVALAELALDDGDPKRARDVLDEAERLATDSGADGVLRLIANVRTQHGESLG